MLIMIIDKEEIDLNDIEENKSSQDEVDLDISDSPKLNEKSDSRVVTPVYYSNESSKLKSLRKRISKQKSPSELSIYDLQLDNTELYRVSMWKA